MRPRSQIALTRHQRRMSWFDRLVALEAARSLQKLEIFLGAVAAPCRAS